MCIRDRDILAAEGISSTDAVITLTNMDEENLIISMYASHIGVPKVITKVNRTEYVEAFKSMGIDTFISPKAVSYTHLPDGLSRPPDRRYAGLQRPSHQ